MRRSLLLVAILCLVLLAGCAGTATPDLRETAVIDTATPPAAATATDVPAVAAATPTDTSAPTEAPAPTVAPPAASDTPAPASSDTPIPSETPAPAASSPYVVTAKSMNVRAGPGTDYQVIGGADAGQQYDCIGRNADGTWLQVSYAGAPAWMFAELVEAHDVEAVPVVEVAPPPATDTPVPAPPTNTPAPVAEAPAGDMAQVVDVVDGDTIKVNLAGQVYTVRYIGIDTPETVHPSKPVEWMGPEASAANRQIVEGQTVRLEKDVSEVDKYDRLLRYVWVGDLMVNAELVRLGYANSSTYPPDVKYQDLFLQLEREAREAGRGLWGEAPVPTAAPIAQPTAAPPASAGCPYIGNANTGKFHHAYCSSVGQMNPSNKVCLTSRDEAISRGFVPCKRCNP